MLEKHLFSIHNVNEEGAKKLLAILDAANWKGKEEGKALLFVNVSKIETIYYFVRKYIVKVEVNAT